MNKTSVVLKVVYNNEYVVEAEKIMSNFDLGIVGIECPTIETYIFKTSTTVDKKYINSIKKHIKCFLKKNGCKLINISLTTKNNKDKK